MDVYILNVFQSNNQSMIKLCLMMVKENLILFFELSTISYFKYLMQCEAKHFCSPTRTYSTSILSVFFAVTKFVLCVAVISRTGHQKIFVQIRDENIEIESLPSVFRSFLECFVHLQ